MTFEESAGVEEEDGCSVVEEGGRGRGRDFISGKESRWFVEVCLVRVTSSNVGKDLICCLVLVEGGGREEREEGSLGSVGSSFSSFFSSSSLSVSES